MNRSALAISFLAFLFQSTMAPAAEDGAFTVLPSAQVTHLAHLCSRDVPGHVTSGWYPTPALVAEAEARLPAFVIRDVRAPKSLDDYYRQYLGVVIGGERIIYVNLFPRWLIESRIRFGKQLLADERLPQRFRDSLRAHPSELANEWRTTFVEVCDGGDRFWSILFDPRMLRFFSPRFNGHI
jgi:hypothetical protein